MELSAKEIWTVLHGMGFGAVYLLAFGGGIADIFSFRPEWVTPSGVTERIRRLRIGMWTMAIVSWITVITGTWLVYIWYRAKPVEGLELMNFPRSFLLSRDSTKGWHTFGMEWKEHAAWIAPLISTSVAYSVTYYRERLVNLSKVRSILIWLLLIAFCSSAIAGIFGAFINKLAATR
jgi:hypothetical protein